MSLGSKKIEEGNKRYFAIAAPVKAGRPLCKDCVPSSTDSDRSLVEEV